MKNRINPKIKELNKKLEELLAENKKLKQELAYHLTGIARELQYASQRID